MDQPFVDDVYYGSVKVQLGVVGGRVRQWSEGCLGNECSPEAVALSLSRGSPLIAMGAPYDTLIIPEIPR